MPPKNENSVQMDHTRRHFIKYTSLAIGASVFSAPSWLHAAGTNVPELRGVVCSGNGGAAVALAGAVVRLYTATSRSPRLRATVTTDAAGGFSIRVHSYAWNSRGIYYLTADLTGGLQLAAVVGPALLPFVTINELTTVAAGYALAQFATQGVVSGDELGLRIAAGMNDNLVAPDTGESSDVLMSSPNGDQTNSWRSTLALANLLALFVRRTGDNMSDVLYDLAATPGGAPATNLLQALSNIARSPQQNVTDLYDLATQVSVYSPTLAGAPDAWTLVVKVNDSGDDNYLIGGPGNIAFDSRGYAWVSNNVAQGTGASGRFNFVLKPDGRPADGTRGTPKSPLLGGGLLGAGYGVGIAPNGHIWFGNFGWGLPQNFPTLDGNGSVSQFNKDGRPISGDLGYQGGPYRGQMTLPDAHGNIWIASFGNNRLYVFLHGNPRHAVYYEDPDPNAVGPFHIQFADDGTAWVTFSGGLGAEGPGYVGRFALKNGKLTKIFLTQVGASIKAIAVDSYGQGWVASGGTDTVYRIDSQGNIAGTYAAGDVGGGMNSPWGISVDGDDNVWVANFGPEHAGSIYSTAGVTKLAGNNPATRPPGLQAGDAISPATGYTLPSAGDEVLLHDGTPLYGENAPASYVPLMRMTAVVIDRAGNLWATNNWKPDFDADLINPGGDGICIFVGLAKPPGEKPRSATQA